jgi:hypothetical protein
MPHACATLLHSHQIAAACGGAICNCAPTAVSTYSNGLHFIFSVASLQPRLWAIKNTHDWEKRKPEILLRGARSTPARLDLFRNKALLESPLTDFAFTDVTDDGAAGFVEPE